MNNNILKHKNNKNKANKAENWFENNRKKSICFLLLLILSLFLSADFIAGQFFLPKNAGEPNPYYHHDLKKNYKASVSWNHQDYIITTNSLGFKDSRVRKIDLSGNKYRILLIGDSATEGVGYPYGLTFAGLFENMLDNTKYEVLNASAVSYSPKLYYFKLKYLIENLGLKFDELFVFIDISDIPNELDYQNFFPNPDSSYFFLRKGGAFLYQNFYLINKAVAVYRTIFAKKSIYNVDITKYDYSKDKGKPVIWREKGFILADKHMALIYELCSKHNIKMNIAVYPWPYHIHQRDSNSFQTVHWKDFAQKRKIGFLDFFPFFINNEEPEPVVSRYFIPGDIHFNKDGHMLIANGLYKYWSEETKI